MGEGLLGEKGTRYAVPDAEFKEARQLEHMLDQRDLSKPCMLVVSLPDPAGTSSGQRTYHSLAQEVRLYLQEELKRIGVHDHVALLVLPESIRVSMHVLKKD